MFLSNFSVKVFHISPTAPPVLHIRLTLYLILSPNDFCLIVCTNYDAPHYLMFPIFLLLSLECKYFSRFLFFNTPNLFSFLGREMRDQVSHPCNTRTKLYFLSLLFLKYRKTEDSDLSIIKLFSDLMCTPFFLNVILISSRMACTCCSVSTC
jgi:hypothetical protein